MIIIRIEDVLEALKIRHKINSVPLGEITWTHRGKAIEVSPEEIAKWNFTGLNNVDFVNIVLRELV